MEYRSSNEIYLDTSFLIWLNQQTGKYENEEWMLDAFLFLLRKIALHGQIRLDKEDYLHQRFWRGMEGVFKYRFLTKSKKPRDIVLYRFMETVAHTEEWISKEGCYAAITDKGREFLAMPRKSQWNKILEYIWPES
ncbi:hypothetical protein [Salibacterium aidingense]|uniref:hypothetical protein n=1 Tax=Salibacterium aidingense TaxID=384933 RepID=UPI000422DC82|nr:hypothetical protein [Salibacterium aidingense]